MATLIHLYSTKPENRRDDYYFAGGDLQLCQRENPCRYDGFACRFEIVADGRFNAGRGFARREFTAKLILIDTGQLNRGRTRRKICRSVYW